MPLAGEEPRAWRIPDRLRRLLKRPAWWNASCEFDEITRQQVNETAVASEAENDSDRYCIATGSRHAGFGGDRVYTDTTGGAPTRSS